MPLRKDAGLGIPPARVVTALVPPAQSLAAEDKKVSGSPEMTALGAANAPGGLLGGFRSRPTSPARWRPCRSERCSQWEDREAAQSAPTAASNVMMPVDCNAVMQSQPRQVRRRILRRAPARRRCVQCSSQASKEALYHALVEAARALGNGRSARGLTGRAGPLVSRQPCGSGHHHPGRVAAAAQAG